jgi:uncharacterized protein (TIGR03435 family)
MRNHFGGTRSERRKLFLTVAPAAALVVALLVGVIAASLSAQTAPGQAPAAPSPSAAAGRPTFDVASIKRSTIWKAGGEGSSRSSIEYSADSLTMRNVDLSGCVQWAYGIEFFQVSGPKSLDAERYDILAKAADPVSVSQLRLMLRQLLADRFKLVLHRDTKTVPVYALIVAKRGPRLTPAKIDSGADVALNHAVESLPRVQDGSFVFADNSLTEFAEKLALLKDIDRPVLDRSGIKGSFDITLKGAATASLQKDGPSIFTLIEEQLGLKLVPQTGPVDVIVIDHVEEPSPN